MWKTLFRAALAPLLLLSALSPGSAVAQSQPPDAEDPALAAARFADDAKGQRLAHRRLGVTRGFTIDDYAAPRLDDIADLLTRSGHYPPGTVLLFYAQRDDALNIYLIGDALLASSSLPYKPADLGWAALQLRAALEVDDVARSRAPRKRGEVYESETVGDTVPTASAIERLSRMLLPTAIGKALADAHHVVIVGNGEIGAIPFAVLTLPGGRLLIEQASLSFASALVDLGTPVAAWRGKAEYGGALVVGNPATPVQPGWSVPPLAGAEAEARTLANSIGATPLIGRAATKAAIVAAAAHASIIYVAAHGIADPSDPLGGGYLMLAGETPSTAFWTAGEIQAMHLEASMAVLSACQSGLGQRHDGGVIGLARAFQLAGVPRVVMSLWSVSDDATRYLMDRFNRHVHSAIPAEALRLAMLETRTRYPDPALWAPFALFGTPR